MKEEQAITHQKLDKNRKEQIKMEKIKKIRMQTQKISNYIWKIIDKRKNLIFFLIVTIIAIFIRKQFMYYQSPDFYGCVQEWFNELKENGGLSALSRNIGNYNPPYLTILALLTYIDVEPIVSIKIVSIVSSSLSILL